MSLRPIKSILTSVTERRPGWSRNFSQAIIWKKWSEVVGEPVSHNAWPERIVGTELLIVRVSDAVWMQQLFLERFKILQQLNSHLPPEAKLKEIRFIQGDVKELKARSKDKRDSYRPNYDNVPEELKERAKVLVSGVRDPELRQRLERVYLAYKLRMLKLNQAKYS
ncbi:DciA family protein [Dissulfuribacter thermophilus]|uniref:DciA family protein n=1 Tax=Dissulfuribacter thermophilus TaxID=1156395 RepID=UPI00082CFEE9|nr:DUF721 domain-containing protein [Dissulfuribacter thermophilus]